MMHEMPERNKSTAIVIFNQTAIRGMTYGVAARPVRLLAQDDVALHLRSLRAGL